ncbi:MAG: glycosyltransferase [Patescibacteria group bacterium]
MKIVMVIPTLNEEQIIERTLQETLRVFAESLQDYDWKVVVADNGSTDTTVAVVQTLMATEPRLGLWTTTKKGKGKAVRGAWADHQAEVYAFMDADLSADLNDVPVLLEALTDADVAVGSRFHPASNRARSLRGEIVSRGYRTLRRLFVDLPVSDSQCGFKALRREAWERIKEDLIVDSWFFDTELLAFAHRAGLTIQEVPIRWTETRYPERQSKINVWASAKDSFKHLLDLRRRLK